MLISSINELISVNSGAAPLNHPLMFSCLLSNRSCQCLVWLLSSCFPLAFLPLAVCTGCSTKPRVK